MWFPNLKVFHECIDRDVPEKTYILTNVTTGIETVLINTSVQWCFDSIFCYNIDSIWERDIVLSISVSLPGFNPRLLGACTV